MPIERKLAAIMFTDIAGYTEQMSKDEAVAISLLNKKESILKPLILEHNGTYVKNTGDGSLSHFNSAVDAATCAKRFQESIYDDKDLNVRVGVHLGDTIFEKGDIRGDGVNIASRLESMAVAGGVFVSKEVHDQLANQKEFEGVSLGLQQLKGLGRLIEVFGLKGDKINEPDPNNYEKDYCGCHSDNEVPSVVIFPFRNKGKEEDEFYSYGIWLDLITEVSGAGLIRVASKKQIDEMGDVSIKEIPNKLCVRYMVNGELWKMADKFQLFIELYDTKESKVIWSDRWQEKWDNLPSIKGSLSDGLLKALDTTSKIDRKVETTNYEAYDFYLQAKHIYEKREDLGDTEIARGLLRKAIKMDDNLLIAKNELASTYNVTGDYDKSMEIYIENLKKAEEIGDKKIVAMSLHNIGLLYSAKGDLDTALDYYERPLKIAEELGDKSGIAHNLHNIGVVYMRKGDLDTALDYCGRSLAITEELGDKSGMGYSLMNIGNVYCLKGNYDKALVYYERSLALREEIGNKQGMECCLTDIGVVYWIKGDYDKALEYYNRELKINEEIAKREEIVDKHSISNYFTNMGLLYFQQEVYNKAIEHLNKSATMQMELDSTITLETLSHLLLSKKILDREYNIEDIHTLIKEEDELEGYVNFALFKLLEDTTYLETAYNQVQEKADNLEPDGAAKFLSYPIPKAIVEEWEKVK